MVPSEIPGNPPLICHFGHASRPQRFTAMVSSVQSATDPGKNTCCYRVMLPGVVKRHLYSVRSGKIHKDPIWIYLNGKTHETILTGPWLQRTVSHYQRVYAAKCMVKVWKNDPNISRFSRMVMVLYVLTKSDKHPICHMKLMLMLISAEAAGYMPSWSALYLGHNGMGQLLTTNGMIIDKNGQSMCGVLKTWKQQFRRGWHISSDLRISKGSFGRTAGNKRFVWRPPSPGQHQSSC